MRHTLLVLPVLLLASFVAFSQSSTTPVIRANSRNVDIRDGLHFRAGWWYILPEKRPDYYFVEFPRQAHRVAFYTDLDSISFDVEYGKTYDFVVLLNGKDSCFTRIAAQYEHTNTFSRNCQPCTGASDTLPFELRGSRMYLQGSLNGSALLDVQFDLGAGSSNISHRTSDQVPIQFDQTVNLINSQGNHPARASSSNALVIGQLRWDRLFFVETHNMERHEDLIVGNSLFQDRVIEINYDHQWLIVHPKAPAVGDNYAPLPLAMSGVTPLIPVGVTIGGRTCTDWFVFDTGLASEVVLNRGFSEKHHLWSHYYKMPGSRMLAQVEQLQVANHTFYDLLAVADKPNAQHSEYSQVGNGLLRQYNVVLDNQAGQIWLAPNQTHPPEPTHFSTVKRRVLWGTIGVAALLTGWLVWRKMR